MNPSPVSGEVAPSSASEGGACSRLAVVGSSAGEDAGSSPEAG
jgi:hypothetical protein